jgi:PAS domain S-box-containing protein
VSLRLKTILIVGTVVLALISGQHSLSYYLLIKHFAQIEREDMTREVDRLREIFSNELVGLDRSCQVYSNWDETYDFMTDSNRKYLEENIITQTFTNLKVNSILFVTPSRQVWFARSIDESNTTLLPVEEDLCSRIVAQLDRLDPNQFIHGNGVLMTSGGPVLLAANSVLTSNGEGPSRGTLIMVRNLNESYLQYISKMAHQNIKMIPLESPEIPKEVQTSLLISNNRANTYLLPLSSDSTAGYSAIANILGQPQLILTTVMSRDINSTGMRIVRFFNLSILAISLVIGALVLWLLEKFILRRLNGLNYDVNRVALASDFGARISVEGGDEISNLASNINNMLGSLEQTDLESRAKEGKLRSIFTSLTEGILITDIRGIVQDCNQAFIDLHAFSSRDDLVGRDAFAFIQPGDLPRAREKFYLLTQGETLKNQAFNIVRKDGTSFAAELSGCVVQTPGNENPYILIVTNDVTDRDRALNKIRWNEALLRSMADSSPLAFFVTNPRTNEILFFNRRFCELWGIQDLEIRMRLNEIKADEIGMICGDHVTDSLTFQTVGQQIQKEEYREVTDNEFMLRDGRIIRLLTSQVCDNQDKYMGRLYIFEDVTEHKLAERALSLSEYRHRLLFERSVAGVFCSTVEGRYLDCNNAYAHILGCSNREEVIGARVEDFFHNPGDREAFIDRLRNQGAVTDYEFHLQRKDGTSIWILENATLILAERGEPLTIQGTIIDITERKTNLERERELQVELMEQSKLANIGLLAAGIAHNVNVPLQGIITQVEMLKLIHPDMTFLDEILTQALRISSIISNMLQKSRQEQCPVEQEIDLNKLLTEELEFLNADLTFKHEINKSYDFHPYLPRIEGIYSDFSQALLNLIRNAIDAMHDSRKKWLSIRTITGENSNIIIEIKDTGCGIPDEISERIFEPFFSTKPLAGQPSGEEPTGTGLGLSSAVQLMRKYKAKLEVDSEVGQGTTFRMIIPPQPKHPIQTTEQSLTHAPELEELLA